MPSLISPFGFAHVTTLTAGNSSSSNTSTIAVPSGAAVGDLCIVADMALNSNLGVPTKVIHTDFIELQDNSLDGASTDIRGTLSAKVLDGSETTLTGMDDSTMRKIAMLFRPDAPIGSFTWNSAHGQATAGNPSAQNIAAASAATFPILLLGQMAANALIVPRSTSLTEVAGIVNAVAAQYLHYLIYGSAPSDQTYDMNDEGVQVMQSGYLSFT